MTLRSSILSSASSAPLGECGVRHQRHDGDGPAGLSAVVDEFFEVLAFDVLHDEVEAFFAVVDFVQMGHVASSAECGEDFYFVEDVVSGGVEPGDLRVLEDLRDVESVVLVVLDQVDAREAAVAQTVLQRVLGVEAHVHHGHPRESPLPLIKRSLIVEVEGFCLLFVRSRVDRQEERLLVLPAEDHCAVVLAAVCPVAVAAALFVDGLVENLPLSVDHLRVGYPGQASHLPDGRVCVRVAGHRDDFSVHQHVALQADVFPPH